MVWIDGTLDVTCDLAFFAKLALIVGHTCRRNYTQLLDKVFAISRIMEVEAGVISGRQRLVSVTEISIILDITKSESNNVLLTWLPLEIMHCGHTWPYYRCPWESLTWLLYNLQLWHHRRWFRECTLRFRPIKKEIASSMYDTCNHVCSVFVAKYFLEFWISKELVTM